MSARIPKHTTLPYLVISERTNAIRTQITGRPKSGTQSVPTLSTRPQWEHLALAGHGSRPIARTDQAKAVNDADNGIGLYANDLLSNSSPERIREVPPALSPPSSPGTGTFQILINVSISQGWTDTGRSTVAKRYRTSAVR